MKFGIIGSGSWATALAKILTDNNNHIHWWVRSEQTVEYIKKRHHNPHYLPAAYFNTDMLTLSSDINKVSENCDVLVIAVPSAYVIDALKDLSPTALNDKKIVSAIKGIIPQTNQLLNEYIQEKFKSNINNYFTVLGPCHAEEVASEKLSYLTFSGFDEPMALAISGFFNTPYMNTKVNHDIWGVQYAAILKNIYALGAGIAHGLEYGDNFLSVYIANCASEMIGFLKPVLIQHPEEKDAVNYYASVYLGDLLVTCYSLYSRNRMFGNMIGKGYSVKAAQLELNMIAEGYNASKCIHFVNQNINASLPIADAIYNVLWKQLSPVKAFKTIEGTLV